MGRESSELYDPAIARDTGIDAFFFIASTSGGVIDSRTYHDPGSFQDRGEWVFPAVDLDSTLPGPHEKSWKTTFGVDDLDDMVERRRGAGIAVEPHA